MSAERQREHSRDRKRASNDKDDSIDMKRYKTEDNSPTVSLGSKQVKRQNGSDKKKEREGRDKSRSSEEDLIVKERPRSRTDDSKTKIRPATDERVRGDDVIDARERRRARSGEDESGNHVVARKLSAPKDPSPDKERRLSADKRLKKSKRR